MMRNFQGYSHSVLTKLEQLDHLSTLEGGHSQEMLQDLLVSVIQAQALFPQSLSQVLPVYECFVGDSYWGKDQARRDEIWGRIRDQLAQGLDAVLSDPTLVERITQEPVPETRGDRMKALCQRIRSEGQQPSLARLLQTSCSGTDAYYEASQLIKLFERKRVKVGHDGEIQRLLYRIELIADRSHHLPP
ncbi:conserved hypothetical protein [Xanthomonas phaseoli pv. phaseoli]|uniref:Uncharacterized protein n=2 Tax=Xanthomonas TaxID=338 RepID=A0A7Z7J0A7_XANCH|nr:conserved hypothetical protein [Xanthomonas phaseoli pv. phaseoli]